MSYNELFNQIRKIRSAQDSFDLRKAMSDILVDLDLTGFTYLEADGDTSTLHFCTYPERWLKRYKEKQYGMIDPIIARMQSEKSAFIWSCDDYLESQERGVSDFFEDARQHGVYKGISIPFRRPGAKKCLFSVVTDNAELDLGFLLSDIKLIADNFNMMFLSTSRHTRPRQVEIFSERERQCLTLVALGASNSEACKILGAKTRSVEHHLQSARDKIGAKNIASAICFLIDTGAINVSDAEFTELPMTNEFDIPVEK